jgi:hypothetical protein
MRPFAWLRSGSAWSATRSGPHATDDIEERARRQDQLRRAERTFDPVPFDTAEVGEIGANAVEHAIRSSGARPCLMSVPTMDPADVPTITPARLA